jgi:hypothetical protein
MAEKPSELSCLKTESLKERLELTSPYNDSPKQLRMYLAETPKSISG